jgi:hypothetical protein
MSCSDFETIIIEIARERLMDAAERKRGLEHIRKCASCSTLLDAERALSRYLRALSVHIAVEEAPERVETALLAAFRQRASAGAPAPVNAKRNRRRSLAVAALAMVAFGMALAGVTSLRKWIASSPTRESQAQRSTMPEPLAGGATGAAIASTPPVAPMPERAPVRSMRPSPPVVARPRPNQSISTSEKRQKRSADASDNRRLANDVAPHEFVTQFFPIMQGVELIPLEGGQVVRVRMPRSNLIPLGIPFNQERANETIKADVLVSNGLARAIRLVY